MAQRERIHGLMKTYVLYHGNCPDGAGAALAYATSIPLSEIDQTEFIPVNYGKPPPDIEDGSRVFILDFSYPRAVLEELNTRCPQLLVLDHHATAKDELDGLLYCRFDMTRSGAVMAWQYFHPCEPVPMFFQYLQDRDLWQWKLEGSREVSAAIGSYGLDWRTWFESSMHLWDPKILMEEGRTCLRLKNQQVDIMAHNARGALINTEHRDIWIRDFNSEHPEWGEIRPGRFYGPVANATVFFSEVGERLMELHPTAPFSAYYFDRSDGRRQWGLRARKDFDAARLIAKPMGGGGHPQACGFTQGGL